MAIRRKPIFWATLTDLANIFFGQSWYMIIKLDIVRTGMFGYVTAGVSCWLSPIWFQNRVSDSRKKLFLFLSTFSGFKDFKLFIFYFMVFQTLKDHVFLLLRCQFDLSTTHQFPTVNWGFKMSICGAGT